MLRTIIPRRLNSADELKITEKNANLAQYTGSQ